MGNPAGIAEIALRMAGSIVCVGGDSGLTVAVDGTAGRTPAGI